jgi:hypothetical protein
MINILLIILLILLSSFFISIFIGKKILGEKKVEVFCNKCGSIHLLNFEEASKVTVIKCDCGETIYWYGCLLFETCKKKGKPCFDCRLKYKGENML